MSTAVNELELPTFSNRFGELPADPLRENQRRQVHGACFSWVDPTPVAAPRTLAYSREVAELLGFSESFCRSENFAKVFAGNLKLPGMEPYAMCYGGHQFGSWAGQLGDGRAINLGEREDSQGERWVLQLKGAGPTPYSRTADGRAVLRSSLREFLCSEAMHHLGVPTTRALSLVATGEEVVRDMFYDGHPEAEPGAIVCRVAQSFLRFGNYELFAAREDLDNLRRLLDFTLRYHSRKVAIKAQYTAEDYVAWFYEVCELTATLMVHWMRVGFVHGVMNTDNMSILGLTIDYGPYGWIDDYDPDWTPNTTDAQGKRYRFSHQPGIGSWNLAQLGNALYPVVGDAEPLQAGLEHYARTFNDGWLEMMGAKLGFAAVEKKDDGELFTALDEALRATETDMTIFYRRLAEVPLADLTDGNVFPVPLRAAFYGEASDKTFKPMREWLRRYGARLAKEGTSDGVRAEQMKAVNPKYVLRNYLAQVAIDEAEAGNVSLLHELLDVLRQPYAEQPQAERFAEKRPEWARSRPGCSMLSCSS